MPIELPALEVVFFRRVALSQRGICNAGWPLGNALNRRRIA